MTVCLLTLSGCAPSKEAQSAGQIGCAPQDITISDETSDPGLAQSTQTWIAECQGKRFVCSKTMTHSHNYVPSSSGGSSQSSWQSISTDSGVACREELVAATTPPSATGTAPSPAVATPSPATTPPPAAPAPAPEQTASPQATPPTGAGGFEFSLDAAGARKACELAGKQWRSESGVHTCSGLARDAGAPATASFEFCGTSTCSIELRFETPAAWLPLVTSLRSKLTEKYGAPENTTFLREACGAEPEFTQCFKDRGERLEYSWGWSSGQRLELRVGKTDSLPSPGIRLIYRKSPGNSALDASSL